MVRSGTAQETILREGADILPKARLPWGEGLEGERTRAGRAGSESWFWKALAAVLTAALAAMVLHLQVSAGEGDAAHSNPELASLEARVAALEGRSQHGVGALAEQVRLSSRLATVESKLNAMDETADWDEAVRLGIASALAKKAAGYTPGQVAHLAATIVRESHAAGIDPQLAAAVIWVESGFDPYAVSPVGAAGLMQLMPRTALELTRDEPVPVRGGHIFDIDRNVHLGCQYLATLIHQFSSVDRALVAYNMGPRGARKALAGKRRRALLAGYPKLVEHARQRIIDAANRPEEGTPVAAVAQTDAAGR